MVTILYGIDVSTPWFGGGGQTFVPDDDSFIHAPVATLPEWKVEPWSPLLVGAFDGNF